MTLDKMDRWLRGLLGSETRQNPPPDHDYAWFSTNILTLEPGREHAAFVRRALAASRAPLQTRWEALFERLPRSWTEEPRFASEDPFHFKLYGSIGRTVRGPFMCSLPLLVPKSILEARALLNAAPIAERAEALWREAQGRIRPWGDERALSARVLWGVTRRDLAPTRPPENSSRFTKTAFRSPFIAARRALANVMWAWQMEAPWDPERRDPALREESRAALLALRGRTTVNYQNSRGDDWQVAFSGILMGDAFWRGAVSLNLNVIEVPGVHQDMEGRRFAELPNPFEPLLDLLRLGVAWTMREVITEDGLRLVSGLTPQQMQWALNEHDTETACVLTVPFEKL